MVVGDATQPVRVGALPGPGPGPALTVTTAVEVIDPFLLVAVKVYVVVWVGLTCLVPVAWTVSSEADRNRVGVLNSPAQRRSVAGM